MADTYEIRWVPRGVINTFHGYVSPHDLRMVQSKNYSDPRADEIAFSIWDFSDCDLSSVSEKDVKFQFGFDLGGSGWVNQNLRLALVAADASTQAHFRYYKELIDQFDVPFGVRIFEDLASAREWCES